MSFKYDALIIGAGPAGSLAARTLANNGRNVLLLEKGIFPGKVKACGGMLPLQSFREYNISETIIEKKIEREISVYPWMRRVIHYPLAIVNRSVFDEHLAIEAKNSGADLKMGCRALSVNRRKSGDLTIKANCCGNMQTFHTKIVIFSDGVNSLAYRTTRIGFKKQPKNVAFGIVYKFEYPENQMTDYYIFFNPKGLTKCGYAWIFPAKNTLNVGVYMPDQEFRKHPYKRRILEKYINTENTEFANLLKGKHILKKLGAHIPLEPATKLCSDSIFIVGDAGGLVSSLTGGGIHYALNSGHLAAFFAEHALSQGNFSGKYFIEYEKGMKSTCKQLRKESFLYKISMLGAPFDPNLYPKLFHFKKLRNSFSCTDNFKVAIYPLLGKL